MENWNQLVPETTLTVIINFHNVHPIAVILRIFPTFFFKVPPTTSLPVPISLFRLVNYLSTELQCVKDMPSRQRLRSWTSDILAVPMSRLSTVGDRAFPVIVA